MEYAAFSILYFVFGVMTGAFLLGFLADADGYDKKYNPFILLIITLTWPGWWIYMLTLQIYAWGRNF